MVLRNYRAVIAYDGTDYSGFQIQVNVPTIQGELEQAILRTGRAQVRVHGAGRTDAGVHAHGQVISFGLDWAHDEVALQRALNAALPHDICVRGVAVAGDTFHARFSATSRVYLYSVYQDAVRSPLLGRFAHRVAWPLDHEAIGQAAGRLIGRMDFAAFGQPPFGTSTVRRVHRAQWVAAGECHPCAEWPLIWRFEIEADAFLRGMVRRLVGTLLSVGQGVLSVDQFEEILASRDIGRASVPAPACGLSLLRVHYREPGKE